MSALYPVMLDLSRCRVLVVGGGSVALRKVRGLLAGGGAPSVVSPRVTPELREIVEAHGLTLRERPFAPGDTAGFHLVFAATDRPEVNATVAREAEGNGGLVAMADDGVGSTFQVPIALREEDLVVAISTGGAAPMLARLIRERVEGVISPGLGRTVRRLAALRTQVQERWPTDESRRRALWSELITPEFLDLALAGRDEEVESRISRCLLQS